MKPENRCTICNWTVELDSAGLAVYHARPVLEKGTCKIEVCSGSGLPPISEERLRQLATRAWRIAASAAPPIVPNSSRRSRKRRSRKRDSG